MAHRDCGYKDSGERAAVIVCVDLNRIDAQWRSRAIGYLAAIRRHIGENFGAPFTILPLPTHHGESGRSPCTLSCTITARRPGDFTSTVTLDGVTAVVPQPPDDKIAA
jgi:hypothetical protein